MYEDASLAKTPSGRCPGPYRHFIGASRDRILTNRITTMRQTHLSYMTNVTVECDTRVAGVCVIRTLRAV